MVRAVSEVKQTREINIWLANKSAIEAHIASGNIDKIAMTLGVKGFDSLEKFGFNFANPIKDRLKISATKEINELCVYNLLGEEVIRESIKSLNSSVDVSNLKTGVYIMKVSIDNSEGTYKIVKE